MRFANACLAQFVCILAAVPVTLLAQIEDDEFRSGIIGRYSDQSGNTFEWRDTSVSIRGNNFALDRRLDGSSLRATWSGYLMSQAVGDYRFHVFGTGNIQVKLDGQIILRAEHKTSQWSDSRSLQLQFDFHPLEVEYDQQDTGNGMRLFWSGPQFQLEPIGSQYLFHDPAQTPDASFERGESLVRALRCAACHQIPNDSRRLEAPSLAHVAENLHFDWLVDWLADSKDRQEASLRRMPHFSFSKPEATAIAAYLFSESKQVERRVVTKKKPDSSKGRQLLLTTGCLACHQLGDVGTSGLFGGGDLTAIAKKRPREFFAHWLTAPGELNAQHRMPLFALSQEEVRDLSTHLSTLGSTPKQNKAPKLAAEEIALGQRLFETNQCASCHNTSTADQRERPRPFDANYSWDNSCLAEPNSKRPGYRLTPEDRHAVIQFISESHVGSNAEPPVNPLHLIAEHNCLACHRRDDSLGLSPNLPAVAEAHPELGELLPAMTPPPLISVGDKLHDQALKDAIQRKSVHRDYLHVRMPKFNLSEDELRSIVDYFVQSDRLPPHPDRQSPPTTDPLVLHTVGSRLVTTDGFGCTSCHQLGSVEPAKAQLNARGPKLTLLAQRIRREWFERFVRNPLRVIPRMEMPSVQVAVSGILDDDLDLQLAAVWDVLNTADFEPPLPDPVRTVRHSGLPEREERSIVITDVVRNGKQTYLKPLLIGLPNRTSFLFDLETAKLVRWSVGDVAQERTEGKSWYWTTAGTPVFTTGLAGSELSIIEGKEEAKPTVIGQFVTEFDEVFHTLRRGIGFRYRLQMDNPARSRISVTQTFDVDSFKTGAVTRGIKVAGLPASSTLKLQLLAEDAAESATANGRQLSSRFGSLKVDAGTAISSDFSISQSANAQGEVAISITYLPHVPIDNFPLIAPTVPVPPPLTLDVVPGFQAVRLPISNEFMPTAMDWRPRGDLVVASLKGRVWNLRDTDSDGLEDERVQSPTNSPPLTD